MAHLGAGIFVCAKYEGFYASVAQGDGQGVHKGGENWAVPKLQSQKNK